MFVSETFPGDLRERHDETPAVMYRLFMGAAIVEPELLFVQIAAGHRSSRPTRRKERDGWGTHLYVRFYGCSDKKIRLPRQFPA